MRGHGTPHDFIRHGTVHLAPQEHQGKPRAAAHSDAGGNKLGNLGATVPVKAHASFPRAGKYGVEADPVLDHDEESLEEGEVREEKVHDREEQWWTSGAGGGHLMLLCLMFYRPSLLILQSPTWRTRRAKGSWLGNMLTSGLQP
ncbi:hypothetical protein NDU88_005146 [Pleurodeles waltl]|uniref:Uncharacterized protein n=1 Tax=Pleurodeles waltl TaxID=8319 RepID=A0AAV7PMU0_PLEWA|nr:hypothetical protein NDU88_005146 [Pleurodeles waltl]